METHQKDIEEKDPFGQNRADEADDDGNDEKSFLKALLAERALKNISPWESGACLRMHWGLEENNWMGIPSQAII